MVCLASGPSLTLEDCALVHASQHPSIVTNTTYRRCPWASVLYAFDRSWWRMHIEEVRAVFAGEKFCESVYVIKRDIKQARLVKGFRAFGNSGASAIALAIALGSRRIIMVGYDLQWTDGQSHWHGDHPAGLSNCETIKHWPGKFQRLAHHAEQKGAQVINASRASALTCFPRANLEDCL